MPTTKKKPRKFPQGGKVVSHGILENGEDLRMSNGVVCHLGKYPLVIWINFLHHVRESQTVLDSRFHATDSRFQVMDSGFFVSGTCIKISTICGVPDSLRCILDFKAQNPNSINKIVLDSGFHKQNFLDSRFPYKNEVTYPSAQLPCGNRYFNPQLWEEVFPKKTSFVSKICFLLTCFYLMKFSI